VRIPRQQPARDRSEHAREDERAGVVVACADLVVDERHLAVVRLRVDGVINEQRLVRAAAAEVVNNE
jgi:hypothetical protein